MSPRRYFCSRSRPGSASSTAPLLRLGIPAAGLAVAALAAIVIRADGRSTPLTMLLPSLRRAAPELTWTTVSGQQGSIYDLRGKVVLVNFWATWCAPCRHEMPMLSAMQARYADRGLVVVYLSLEDREVVEPFLRAHPLTGTAARLEHAADYYQAGKFFPITFLLARDGSVEKRWSGRPTEQWLADSIEEPSSSAVLEHDVPVREQRVWLQIRRRRAHVGDQQLARFPRRLPRRNPSRAVDRPGKYICVTSAIRLTRRHRNGCAPAACSGQPGRRRLDGLEAIAAFAIGDADSRNPGNSDRAAPDCRRRDVRSARACSPARSRCARPSRVRPRR